MAEKEVKGIKKFGVPLLPERDLHQGGALPPLHQ